MIPFVGFSGFEDAPTIAIVFESTRICFSTSSGGLTWGLAMSADLRGAGDLAHAARLVVAHGGHDLLLAVHHERTVARDRFAMRHTGEKQQARRALGSAQTDGVAVAQDAELSVANLSA